MTETKQFWQVCNALLLGLYIIALALVLGGSPGHWGVMLVAIILVAHVLELPLAMHQLKDRDPAMGRLIVGTVLFGFTWWLPAKRGIYLVR